MLGTFDVQKKRPEIVQGFNFYGNEKWQEKRKLVNILWELLHNRVTSNVLNRIKQLAEWRIANIKENKVADTQAKNL